MNQGPKKGGTQDGMGSSEEYYYTGVMFFITHDMPLTLQACSQPRSIGKFLLCLAKALAI
jgi:hypothetical protein